MALDGNTHPHTVTVPKWSPPCFNTHSFLCCSLFVSLTQTLCVHRCTVDKRSFLSELPTGSDSAQSTYYRCVSLRCASGWQEFTEQYWFSTVLYVCVLLLCAYSLFQLLWHNSQMKIMIWIISPSLCVSVQYSTIRVHLFAFTQNSNGQFTQWCTEVKNGLHYFSN